MNHTEQADREIDELEHDSGKEGHVLDHFKLIVRPCFCSKYICKLPRGVEFVAQPSQAYVIDR